MRVARRQQEHIDTRTKTTPRGPELPENNITKIFDDINFCCHLPVSLILNFELAVNT